MTGAGPQSRSVSDGSPLGIGRDQIALCLPTTSIVRGLGWAVALLTCAHLLSETLQYFWWPDWPLARLLALDSEANPATTFSTMQILFCALLLARIAASPWGRQFGYYWNCLAAAFLYLAFDEASIIHEMWTKPTRTLVSAWAPELTESYPVILGIGWVIPAGVIVVVFGLVYLPFLGRLPGRTAALFVVAAVIFISGSIGLEIGNEAWSAGILEDELDPKQRFFDQLFIGVEEAMEMSGILLFAYALLDLCDKKLGGAMTLLYIGTPARSVAKGEADRRTACDTQ
jgi:hypothetical protein